MPTGDGRSVTAKIFAILGTFTEERTRCTLTELATSAGMPLSTAFRLAAELVEQGALARDQRFYHVGERIWQLGRFAPSRPKVHPGGNVATRQDRYIGEICNDRQSPTARCTGDPTPDQQFAQERVG